jgi:branched-chain amino acid transport system substrate-binding protein
MNNRNNTIISLLGVVVLVMVSLSLHSRGVIKLPGLPVPNSAAQPLATAPAPPAPPAPPAATAPATPPPATAPPATSTSAKTDPLLVLKPAQAKIIGLMRSQQWAEAVAEADVWLQLHPTDAMIGLERSNAILKLTNQATIELGFSAPLAGSLKQVGEAFAQGVLLALSEANVTGIKGKRLLLRMVNDGGERTQALAAAAVLFGSPVVGVIGPYSSSTTLAAAAVYNQGLAIIAPAATNPKISSAGPYIYRVAPSDREQGAALARLMQKNRHQNVLVLSDSNDAYSKGLAESFIAEAKAIGLGYGQQQFTLGQFQNINSTAGDALFVAGYTNDVAAAAKISNRSWPIYAGDGAYGQDLLAQGGNAVEGVIMTTFFHATQTEAAAKAFTQRFRRRFAGGTPNANAMQAYDATRTMIEALRRAKTLDREGVKAALESFGQSPGPGVTAPVRFNADGDVIGRPWIAITVKKGKFQAIGAVK